MGYGNSANTFAESLENSGIEKIEAGQECPEDGCKRELFELNHPRNSRFEGVQRHPDAPETEVVCIHHGVVESY